MHFNITEVIVVSIATSVLVMPLLIKLFSRKNIVDKSEERKIHESDIPTMGGVGFFIATFATLLFLIDFEQLINHKVEILTLSLMFLVGLRDDLIELKPIFKLLAQVVPVLLIIFVSGTFLPSLYGFLGIYEIPYWAGIAISTITFLGLTNSYNLIDGLDGLAGSLALMSSFILGIWFYLHDVTFYSMIAIAFSGSLIGFLYYNWQPARIFMGDTGALIIGFLLSILLFKFIESNSSLPQGSVLKFNSGIAFGLSILYIPIFDTLRIIIVRVVNNISPFKADKNHIHHLLIEQGLTHKQTTLILITLNIFIIACAYSLDFLGNTCLLLVLMFIGIILSAILNILKNKGANSKAQIENNK